MREGKNHLKFIRTQHVVELVEWRTVKSVVSGSNPALESYLQAQKSVLYHLGQGWCEIHVEYHQFGAIKSQVCSKSLRAKRCRTVTSILTLKIPTIPKIKYLLKSLFTTWYDMLACFSLIFQILVRTLNAVFTFILKQNNDPRPAGGRGARVSACAGLIIQLRSCWVDPRIAC